MSSSSSDKVDYTPVAATAPPAMSVVAAEGVLADWFGGEVVLTSAGRSAILLYLTLIGLNRYRDRIRLPRLISTCVLDAVIRRGFPVDAADGTDYDFAILYHQYGFSQVARPTGRVMEDICHAFFATPETGERDWAGEAAVFSLPKFFSMAGMCGGLVVQEHSRATELRALRDHTGDRSSGTSHSIAGCGDGCVAGSGALELAYLARLLNPRLRNDETGGIPGSVAEIRRIGLERRWRLDRLISASERTRFPEGWLPMLGSTLPFAFPIFGDDGQLTKMKEAFSDAGIAADVYTIDVARKMTAPSLERAILVPCHHLISGEKLDVMTNILTSMSCA